MLFDKDRHESLSKSSWKPNIVEAEIFSIIDDIQGSLLPDACWPTHPLDAESYPKTGPKWAAYAGAAGTIHALQILSGYGYKISDLSGLIAVVYQSFLKTPDVSVEPGLQLGELGILMPAILAQPDDEKLTKLVMRCMEDTIALPLYEITSGQSGMMHAALALYRKTAKAHWKDLYLKGAKSLMDHWTQDPDTGQWLWQSQVFGPKRHYYGACHGITGNANILLQGADLLPPGYTEMIIKRTVSTLHRSAKQESNLANWTLCTKPNIDKLLVQWCHGAAGIVTAMARTPVIDSPEAKQLDHLLEQTGELVWQAGPLVKGANICHGTSGNGYAFLYLYQKTGKSVWLDRARQFAMHAIEQCQKARLHYGQGRFTLWTGDAGLAIYLYHCITPEKAAIPGLDLF
ncbi:lanthionine synthetase C family protein [Thalassomonas haliotis]|uniref:LanC-like protein n=1 Tax=Thalassomonas haliotis TaxID=485448 RepID=A0ABY7V6N9_9GAMM|nr:LanC-like protein [Thalassomonas haliotis]WDE09378.1 LanC-like protein [Thalassomonas haliotis]